MNDVARTKQEDRQRLRWRVLNAADNSKPVGLGDRLALRIAGDTGFNVEISQIRDAFDYIEGKGLVTVKRLATEWVARITDEGVDVVEGNMDCPAGIAKPEW